MADWQKLDKANPSHIGGDIGLELIDKAGNKLALRFAPDELSRFIAFTLTHAYHDAKEHGGSRPQSVNTHPIPVTAIDVQPGAIESSANFSILCGSVPVMFLLPLSTLLETLESLRSKTAAVSKPGNA